MMRVLVLLGAIFAMTTATTGAGAAEPENTLLIDTVHGRITVELLPDRKSVV